MSCACSGTISQHIIEHKQCEECKLKHEKIVGGFVKSLEITDADVQYLCLGYLPTNSANALAKSIALEVNRLIAKRFKS